MSNALLQEAKALQPWLQEVFFELHRNPEIGGKEFKTQALVLAELKKMGIDMDDADNQTAVVVGLLGRAMKGDPKASALLFEQLDDGNGSGIEQEESHNALIDAIRKRNNED